MANLIIKSSADNLVLQGSDASPAITVGATGTTTFAENTTLSGTANNLGTVTAGTFEGTLNSSTTFSGDAGKATAKAWCQFNGTSTGTIPEEYNVSSITDNATGQYGVNFSTALSTSTYVVAGCHDSPASHSASFCTDHWNANSTTQCTISTFQGSAYADPPEVHVIIFGD